MRTRLAILVSVLCSACPGGGEREMIPCGPFADRYETRWEQRPGGTCADIPATEVTGDDLTGLGPECTGTTHVSEDGCDVIVDERCLDETGRFVLDGTGTLSQVAGPARVEGVLELELQDALTDEPQCNGTYDVTATAL